MPPPRKDFLIEYYSDKVFPRIRNMGYEAVRTRQWKYIRYRRGFYLQCSGATKLLGLAKTGAGALRIEFVELSRTVLYGY
jgi:hypothetical protein